LKVGLGGLQGGRLGLALAWSVGGFSPLFLENSFLLFIFPVCLQNHFK
jgi:hypothetical protein